MSRLLLISVASALVSPGMAVARDQSESHGPYSVERRGNIGDLHTVWVYLIGQAAEGVNYAAFENSGLDKKDINALKRAADALNKQFRELNIAHAKAMCQEGPNHAESRAEFRAFLADVERSQNDARANEIQRVLKPLTSDAYLWLREQLSSIEFHTTYAGDYFSGEPADAVKHACQMLWRSTS